MRSSAKSAALEAGEKLQQETRGWDEKTGTTILQRSKEGSIDYRYFPEPDLPPIVLEDAQLAGWSAEITEELPAVLRKKAEGFGLPYDRTCELQDKNELIKFLEVLGEYPKADPLLWLIILQRRFNRFL